MPVRTPTKVFVPNTQQIPRTPGTVVACHKRRGERVEAEEALFEIRFADVDAEVLAPLTGTLVGLHVAAGDTVSVGWPLADISTGERLDASPSDPLAARLLAHAPFAIALALSAVALIWPLLWLAVVLAGSFLFVGIERTWVRGLRPEPAEAVLFPLRVLASSGRWLRERFSQPAPLAGTVRFAGWLGVAIVGTGAVGGLVWLTSHGGGGVVAAMRLADFAHAFRIFAFLACVSLIRVGLSAPARRAYLARALSGIPGAGLAAAVTLALIWVVLCAMVLPRDSWWPASNLRTALNSMPVGLRDTAREWERSLAETEARAVVECAAQRGFGGWLPPTGLLGPDGTVAVAVNFDRAAPPNDRSLAVLMLALQNQLAPNTAVIIVHTDKPRARIRYGPIPTTSPITEAGVVADRVTPSARTDAHLAALRSMPEQDVKVALRCSAVAF
jgi:pyruvate/2-oxoglutarate dehydrogenase complex dihydrolipoamide acyltransferase (E2) component